MLGDDERALYALGDVEFVDFAAVEPRKILEVGDNLRNLADTVAAVLDHGRQLLRDVMAAQLVYPACDERKLAAQFLLARAACPQQAEQFLGLFDQSSEPQELSIHCFKAVLDVGERCVDLVSNTGNHLAER